MAGKALIMEKYYPLPSLRDNSGIRDSIVSILLSLLLFPVTGRLSFHNPTPWNDYRVYSDRSRLGLSPKSELRISDDSIQFYDYGIQMHTIPREKLHMNQFEKHHALYFVFSKDDIELLKTDALIEMIKNKKAFCFPYVWQAKMDYPELFRIKPPVP